MLLGRIALEDAVDSRALLRQMSDSDRGQALAGSAPGSKHAVS
jgi:hypothetical protein